MSKKRNKSTQLADDSKVWETRVYKALQSMGRLIPEHEDDIIQAEKELFEDKTPLPESLADAAVVFNGKPDDSDNIKTLRFAADAQVEENLARAARGSDSISPEIEDRMRRDREDAQRQWKQDEHGDHGDHGKNIR